MKHKFTISILITLLSLTITASSLDFYKNLSEEGKKSYLAGKYEEAVENFRIAEFGLMEEKTVLMDMYLYYSLAHFKLSNGDEVIEIANKLKNLTGVSTFNELRFPDEISEDLDVMFSIIDKTYKRTVKKNENKNPAVSKKIKHVDSKEYGKVYNNVRQALKENDLIAVRSGLKILKRSGKNNVRTKLVSGIVYFRGNKYKKAINELLPVSRFGSADLVNEASYYLALSNYFEKNYGQFLVFSQKVVDKNANGKLTEIRKKVEKIRAVGILKIKNNFFNKRNFKELASAFSGDIEIASSILKEVKIMIPLKEMDIYYMANSAIKYPGVYDRDFILDLIRLFSEREMEEYAVDIVKRSKYYKSSDSKNIEILYQLGIVYHDMENRKQMKKIMQRVKKIHPDYKKVNYYLTN